jgi:TolB-like protein
MSSLFQELKRRNVFRVGLAYAAIAWLILQASDIVLENFGTPAWVMKTLMFFLAIGFPVAVFFAWAYEMTPEGIKRENEVDRTQSITQQTGQKLNRTIIVVLLAAVGFLLVDKFVLQEDVPTTAAAAKSVAVLPFVAMSRGPDDEYFADGLTEEILNSLTRVPELLVTARTSAFHFKGQDIPIPEIADALGVEHVVEGSVRRDGDRLRVTAQLIRADDGFHLWSENYDRETEDTFGVQTDIAEKIATALDVVLDEEQRASMKAAGMRNPEAYILLQKGRKAFVDAHSEDMSSINLLKANESFDRVIALEPGASVAYFLRADRFAHFLIEAASDPTITVDEQAAAFAEFNENYDAAIQTSNDEAFRNAAAYDQALISGRWRLLPNLMDRIYATQSCINPGWLNQTSMSYGRADDMLRQMQKEIECDPLSFSGYWDAANSLVWLGRFDEAIAIASEGWRITRHSNVRNALVYAYLGAGRINELERFVEQEVYDSVYLYVYRMLLAAMRGDEADANRFRLEVAAKQPKSLDLQLLALAIMGDRNGANELAASIDGHPYGYLILMQLPMSCACGIPFDLEYTPNFARLVEEANLAWPPPSPINWPLKDW